MIVTNSSFLFVNVYSIHLLKLVIHLAVIRREFGGDLSGSVPRVKGSGRGEGIFSVSIIFFKNKTILHKLFYRKYIF